MSPEDLHKVLYQCGGETIMLDVFRQTTPISSAGSSPIPQDGRSGQEPILVNSMKLDPSKRWDTASESSKGSMKNIKSSGSQTDSLDSPSVPRKGKNHKSDKDLESKGRPSSYIKDTVISIFKPRNKSAERVDPDKGQLSLMTRPQTMIVDRGDLAEFVFAHRREDSNSSNTNRSKNVQRRDSDPEMSGTGTWPKCMRLTATSTINGTVISPAKNYHKRPTLDALKVHQGDTTVTSVPTARVPPLPPERNNSSFIAVRHTPQNSDSTITYNSHPPSPSLSPQPSNSSTSSYFPKSPSAPRRSFNFHEPQDSQSSLNQGQNQNLPPYPNNSYQSQVNQSSHRSKTSTTKNPPRIANVHTNQYQLPDRTRNYNTPRRRPISGPSHDQRNPNYLSPTSHNPPSHVGSRSSNTTPEPTSKPLPGFLDHHGKMYPSPNFNSNG